MMKILRSVFDKNFIKLTMMIAFPIMVQTGITNFVNMLDNIMVGLSGICVYSAGFPGSVFLLHSTAAKMIRRGSAIPSGCRS